MSSSDPQECTAGCFQPPNPPQPPPKNELNEAEKHQYAAQLSAITCDCGYGYFRKDASWVSGADVRAGRMPTRDGMMIHLSETVGDPQGEDA